MDLDGERIHLRTQYARKGNTTYESNLKDHEIRQVAIMPWLADELRPIIAPTRDRHDPGPLVFPSPWGKRWNYQNFINRVFKPAVAHAGLGHVRGLTLHSLRHTAVSLAIATGAHQQLVQNMVGHASIQRRYDAE